MPPPLANIITAATVDPAARTVTLTWANGAVTVHDFRAHLAGDGVFAALTDSAVFAYALPGDRGRTLEWPGGIDLCADALWFEPHPEDAPARAAATA